MSILTNSRHELFALAIAQGKSASEAFVIAGFKAHGSNAHRLSQKEQIVIRVSELMGAAVEKAGVTVDRIVAELAKIGFADITQAVEWGEALAVKSVDGGEAEIIQGVALTPSGELPANVSAAISEVRKTKEGISIKFHDKKGALELLGRHLGMFKDKGGPGDAGGTTFNVTMNLAAPALGEDRGYRDDAFTIEHAASEGPE